MENKEIEKKNELEKLGVMRIVALAVLGFALYWVFSDMGLNEMEMRLLPMFYVLDGELYLMKRVTALIVPVLFNLALWIPRYGSYLLIRSVLYTEGVKYIAMLGYYLINLLGAFFFAASIYQVVVISLIVTACYLWLIKVLNKEMKTEEYKKHFRVEGKEEKKLKKTAVILAVALYAAVYGGAVLESRVQASYAIELVEESEAKVTTYDKVELMKKIPYGKSFLEIETYSKLIISPDGKKIMLIQEKKGSEGIEIFDIASGEKIRRLDILAPSAQFTPDGKNIIWMNYDRLGERKKISFEVINIETGEINRDFQDRTFLKKEREKKESGDGVLDIQFSPDNKHFTALGRWGKGGGVELWDYHTGQLIDYYGIGENIEELFWLSENKFVTVKEILDEQKKVKDKEVMLNEILEDGTVKRTKKKKIVQQMKASEVLDGRIYAVHDGKDILIMEGIDNVFGRRSLQLLLCDLETGQIKLNIAAKEWSSYDIDDKGNLVVVEAMEVGRMKITLWDIKRRAKKKVLYANIEKWDEFHSSSHGYLINGGKKLAFIKNSIQFVDLE